MDLYLNYILRSSACLALFYLFYKLILSRSTFHRLNRFTLLGILFMSIVLPFYKRMILLPDISPIPVTVHSYPEPVERITTETVHFMWMEWIPAILYLSGMILIAGIFVYSVIRLICSLRKGEKVCLEDNIYLILTDRKILSFSWMRYIVVSRDEWNQNTKEIFLHEKAHINAGHSWDLMILQCCLFIFWFNPFIWFLKRELQTVHEYEADQKVLDQGVNRESYQYTLIRKVVGEGMFTMLVSSFNHSYLKKRIHMMLRTKSLTWHKIKYLGLVPLVYLIGLLVAQPAYSYQQMFPDEEIEEGIFVEEPEIPSMVEEQKEPVAIAEYPVKVEERVREESFTPPPLLPQDTIPGNTTKRKNDFLGFNIKPPADPFTRIMKNMTPELKMPSRPALFYVPGPDSLLMKNETIGKNLKIRVPGIRKKDPIVVIDNVVYDRKILDEINPGLIKTISVLKGGDLTSRYGEKAEGGVIIISLKNNFLNINSVNNGE